MEKRISHGPNSLSPIDVRTLDIELTNIMNEMKEYNNDPKGSMEMIQQSYEDESESGDDVMDVTVKKEGEFIYILIFILLGLNHVSKCSISWTLLLCISFFTHMI